MKKRKKFHIIEILLGDKNSFGYYKNYMEAGIKASKEVVECLEEIILLNGSIRKHIQRRLVDTGNHISRYDQSRVLMMFTFEILICCLFVVSIQMNLFYFRNIFKEVSI